jgi:hypothetical protein
VQFVLPHLVISILRNFINFIFDHYIYIQFLHFSFLHSLLFLWTIFNQLAIMTSFLMFFLLRAMWTEAEYTTYMQWWCHTKNLCVIIWSKFSPNVFWHAQFSDFTVDSTYKYLCYVCFKVRKNVTGLKDVSVLHPQLNAFEFVNVTVHANILPPFLFITS